jgi:hypothetical protein
VEAFTSVVRPVTFRIPFTTALFDTERLPEKIDVPVVEATCIISPVYQGVITPIEGLFQGTETAKVVSGSNNDIVISIFFNMFFNSD